MKRTITILVGPPLSGKSTEAYRMLAGQENLLRVNRDDFRYMLRNKGLCHYSVENIINGLQYHAIDRALEAGKDVVIDNTHCKVKYIEDITRRYDKQADICVEVFYTSLWKLKLRNIWRKVTKGIWIPPRVIDAMYTNMKDVVKYLDTHKDDYCKGSD